MRRKRRGKTRIAMKVADMHCDTISELYKNRIKGMEGTILENGLMVDLKKMAAGDYLLQNFALYVNLERDGDRPFEYCMELLDTFYQELEAHKDMIGIVTSYHDIEENRKARGGCRLFLPLRRAASPGQAGVFEKFLPRAPE